MSSKIHGVDARPVPIGAGQAVGRGRDATAGSTGQPAGQHGVHITESARRLAALEQSVREMPAVDEARVAEVSRELAEGRYEVRPERIAEGLLQLERQIARHGEGK